jgi:hypothetical protein
MFERYKARRREARELDRRWEEYQRNPRPGGPNTKYELPGARWEVSQSLRDSYIIRGRPATRTQAAARRSR